MFRKERQMIKLWLHYFAQNNNNVEIHVNYPLLSDQDKK